MIAVRIIDGRPALILDDRVQLDELQRVLHQVNSTEVWRGREPIRSAIDFVRAARAAVVLIDSALVPHAEPNNDAEVPVEGAWITTQEASRLLGISTRAVTKRVAAGTLIARKVGGNLLIDSKELAADAAA